MNEILNFCRERNILLEGFFYDIFLDYDEEKVKEFILSLSKEINKKFISKKVFFDNKDLIVKILDDIFFEHSNEIKNKIYIKKDFDNDLFFEKTFSNSKEKIDVSDFVEYFSFRYKKTLEIIQKENKIFNLSSINKVINSNQKCSIVGMVFDKIKTKNGNIIFEIEDLTGKIKVIVSSKSQIFEDSDNVCLDSVLGFVGSIRGDVMFLEKIIFPNYKLNERKKLENDENAIFIGDLHFGSKNFMKKSFQDFVDYLNSGLEEAKKIKYLFLVGDLVAGVGRYPNQMDDLEIPSIKNQFFEFSKILNNIRKDINIIILPGNHDGIRLMEPQPVFSEKYAESIINLENVILLQNPGEITISKKNKNKGITVLCYHGFSFPYYYNNVSELLSSNAINDPVKIMKYLLKNRHLAPSHSSTQYFPLSKDSLLIENIPDIFVAGHTHKLGISYENNVLFISVSSWEKITEYQKRMGNEPDFCKIPMVNLKTRAVKILDFYKEDENEDRN